MDPKAQLVWFLLALVFFAIATLWGTFPERNWRLVSFGWLGLFCFTVVFFWTAWKAA